MRPVFANRRDIGEAEFLDQCRQRSLVFPLRRNQTHCHVFRCALIGLQLLRRESTTNLLTDLLIGIGQCQQLFAVRGVHAWTTLLQSAIGSGNRPSRSRHLP